MDATGEASHSDLCQRVIKPPLREASNPIHHGNNEMKMNSSISLSQTLHMAYTVYFFCDSFYLPPSFNLHSPISIFCLPLTRFPVTFFEVKRYHPSHFVSMALSVS